MTCYESQCCFFFVRSFVLASLGDINLKKLIYFYYLQLIISKYLFETIFYIEAHRIEPQNKSYIKLYTLSTFAFNVHITFNFSFSLCCSLIPAIIRILNENKSFKAIYFHFDMMKFIDKMLTN